MGILSLRDFLVYGKSPEDQRISFLHLCIDWLNLYIMVRYDRKDVKKKFLHTTKHTPSLKLVFPPCMHACEENLSPVELVKCLYRRNGCLSLSSSGAIVWFSLDVVFSFLSLSLFFVFLSVSCSLLGEGGWREELQAQLPTPQPSDRTEKSDSPPNVFLSSSLPILPRLFVDIQLAQETTPHTRKKKERARKRKSARYMPICLSFSI